MLIPDFSLETLPYVLLRQSDSVHLVDLKNLTTYEVISDAEYSYSLDWLDGDAYEWASTFMVVR